MQDNFLYRHVGVSRAEQLKPMLDVIGVSSLDELISEVVPEDIRLKAEMDLPKPMAEWQFAEHIRALAAKNKPLRTLIGMGYYRTASPAVILRNIFENPAWYTSYTPYQAEISQGRLEALLNFQTMVMSLTGMEISNCSLLDEATSAAEAMLMMFSLRSREAVKEGRNVLFVDENIFPQTLDLLLTRSEPRGIELVVDDFSQYEFSGREFGAIVQYPAADGRVCCYGSFAEKCHANGCLLTASVDLLSLALLKSPAEWGADVVVGTSQRFGIPMGFGGPSAGFLATKDAYKRSMPGRIIGVSVDRLGNKALRMALQTREQHIKREKATSNICTAQALLATMAGMFAVYHGPDGIRRIALNAHSHAAAFAIRVEELGYVISYKDFFDTVEVQTDSETIRKAALAKGYNLCYASENLVRVSFDELSTLAELNDVISIFAESAGKPFTALTSVDEKVSFAQEFERSTPILQEKIFNSFHSETEMMRYIKKLELRDISLANSMISLGSCTMKLNPAVTMMPLSLDGFANVHPFVPADQAEGYMEMIDNLSKYIATITGFDGVTFQPNSGAAGEYTGLMLIRAYHLSRADEKRRVMLIPASAHGTNPASAAMAGMQVVVTACDANGNIDVEDWRAKASQYSDTLAGCMITYPSTHGIFESRIRELVKIIHDNGGQVYYDGANMNAVVGLSSPGYIGADVCHLNLHKTFAIPHGGGGPGVGAVCTAKHLSQFLPSHPMVKAGGENGITAVSASPFGSAMILPITYGYILMLGSEGLRHVSETAILNANYLASRLKGKIDIVYSGETGRVGHETILDYRRYRQDFGVECGDVARRLMDFGFHAPTLSFPVHDTLMVEPTESESKAEIDRFADALLTIAKECEENVGNEDHIVKNAPYTAAEAVSDSWSHPYSREQAAYPLPWVREFKFWPYVTKIDNGYGDRNLVTTSAELEQ